jgi:hypothetical protein
MSMSTLLIENLLSPSRRLRWLELTAIPVGRSQQMPLAIRGAHAEAVDE